MRRIVVAGASLAGLRAAETLRAEGFDGELTVVGAEPHPPYTRPPLSKGLLTGAETADSLALQSTGDLDARWLLGRTAERLDLDRREVVLDQGERLAFDGLVVATGARPRPWPGGPTPPGVLALRTVDDALALRRASGVPGASSWSARASSARRSPRAAPRSACPSRSSSSTTRRWPACSAPRSAR